MLPFLPQSMRAVLALVSVILLAGRLAAVVSPGTAASPPDRVRLAREHADFRIQYVPGSTNELFVVVHDADARTNYASTNVVLVADVASEVTLPEGFPEFGEPGAPFWILPASQNPELLYLGVSGGGLPAATFAGPLAIRLVEVRAPGSFFAWQFGSDGTLEMAMNSRDGIGPADRISVTPGGHAHFNWGFSSNGWFEVTFRVEGRLAGAETNLLAANTTFLFAVEPVPTDPPPAAQLSAPFVQGGRLLCELTGRPGTDYAVEISEDLEEWTPSGIVVAGNLPTLFSVDLPPDSRSVFVRAISPSP